VALAQPDFGYACAEFPRAFARGHNLVPRVFFPLDQRSENKDSGNEIGAVKIAKGLGSRMNLNLLSKDDFQSVSRTLESFFYVFSFDSCKTF